MTLCDFRRVIEISDKIDVVLLKNAQEMKHFLWVVHCN